MVEQIERAIRLEGAFNVRDLGGIQTSTGDMVKTGRLFRADALSALTDSDLEILAGTSLATVIDLRTTYELENHGSTRLVDSGARHLHLPIFEGNLDRTGMLERPDTLGELYVQMVDNAADRFVRIFNAIAEPGSLPAVFHCTAGKDRTGVTASLILGMLGVPKDEIVADYAATDVNMKAMLEYRRKSGLPMTASNVPDHYMRAVPATMEDFLTVLEERWGSTNGYLDHIGVPQPIRDTIANEMLA